MASRYPDAYKQMLVRLRQARLEAGFSQEAVAEVLGVRQNIVSKIELGDRRIDPVELAVLAKMFGKPIAWFVE